MFEGRRDWQDGGALKDVEHLKVRMPAQPGQSTSFF